MASLTVNLKGGIGNQLFQIALIAALSKRFGINYYIQDGQFEGAGTGSHPSKYYTSIYKKICRKPTQPSTKIISERTWTYYDIAKEIDAYISTPQILQLDGYFQSDRYFYGFDREIKDLFTPAEGIRTWLLENSDLFVRYPELFKEEDHGACFIGVRRGDYIQKAAFHNPCYMDYYKQAMSKFSPAQKYYIGTDDPAWCKEQFVGDQFVIFDIKDDLIQLYAGCLFKKYIIANSTFHWWMSFLSVYDDPVIYAPNKWIFGSRARWEQYSTIYRKSMIVLERLTQ